MLRLEIKRKRSLAFSKKGLLKCIMPSSFFLYVCGSLFYFSSYNICLWVKTYDVVESNLEKCLIFVSRLEIITSDGKQGSTGDCPP